MLWGLPEGPPAALAPGSRRGSEAASEHTTAVALAGGTRNEDGASLRRPSSRCSSFETTAATSLEFAPSHSAREPGLKLGANDFTSFTSERTVSDAQTSFMIPPQWSRLERSTTRMSQGSGNFEPTASSDLVLFPNPSHALPAPALLQHSALLHQHDLSNLVGGAQAWVATAICGSGHFRVGDEFHPSPGDVWACVGNVVLLQREQQVVLCRHAPFPQMVRVQYFCNRLKTPGDCQQYSCPVAQWQVPLLQEQAFMDSLASFLDCRLAAVARSVVQPGVTYSSSGICSSSLHIWQDACPQSYCASLTTAANMWKAVITGSSSGALLDFLQVSTSLVPSNFELAMSSLAMDAASMAPEASELLNGRLSQSSCVALPCNKHAPVQALAAMALPYSGIAEPRARLAIEGRGAPTPKLLCGEPALDDDLASVEVVPQVYMRPEAVQVEEDPESSSWISWDCIKDSDSFSSAFFVPAEPEESQHEDVDRSSEPDAEAVPEEAHTATKQFRPRPVKPTSPPPKVWRPHCRSVPPVARMTDTVQAPGGGDGGEEELDRQDPKRQRDHSLNRPVGSVVVCKEAQSERSEDNKRQRRRPRSLSTTSKPPLLPSAKELPPVKSFSMVRDALSKSRLAGRHRTAIAAAAALSLDTEVPVSETPEAPTPSMASLLTGESLNPGASLHRARPYTRHRAAIRDARALCLNVESDIDRLSAPRLLRVHSVPSEAAESKKPPRDPRAVSESRQRAVSSSFKIRPSVLMHDGPKC
ncbi:unnamed protein product [Symbiodinium sp. CCMP2456]|nr:unnamed protein product [Symbiodinium sp. CCMP2456]